MMQYSWCPPGGAVGHRAGDLQAAEETRGHGDPPEERGNSSLINLSVNVYLFNSAFPINQKVNSIRKKS